MSDGNKGLNIDGLVVDDTCNGTVTMYKGWSICVENV